MGATAALPFGAADDYGRLVWRLLSPSARLLSCRLRKFNGHFELVVANGEEEILTSSASAIEPLHARAAGWRMALQAHGYIAVAQAPGGVGAVPASPQSEPRAAFRSLIQCADLLADDEREIARELRSHATTGLVALALRDAVMTRDVIASARAALARNSAKDTGIRDLLNSCEALLSRIEASL